MTQPNQGLHKDVLIKAIDESPLHNPPHITNPTELFDYRMKMSQSSMMTGASFDLSKPFKAMTYGDIYILIYYRDKNKKQKDIWDAMSEEQKDQMYEDMKEQERLKKRDEYIFQHWKH